MSTATTHIKTEKQLVPELRFKEFEGDWKKEPVGNHFDLMSGFAFKSDDISEDSSGVPILRGINITEGYIRHNEKIDRYFLGDTSRLDRLRVKVGDLVLGMDGSKVGKNSALVTENDADSLLIQRVARLREKKGSCLSFVYSHINSIRFHKYVDVVNTSSGIPHISSKQINDFKIFFPETLPEQQKIASFLSAVDEKIQQLTRKKNLLKQYKKGVMQQLFSGQLRFKNENGNPYPNWEEKQLDEITTFKRGKNIAASDQGAYYLLGMGAVAESGKLLVNKKIDYSDDFLMQNDLVMPERDIGVGLIIGRVARIDGDNKYILGANILSLTMNEHCVSDYIYHQINDLRFRRKMKRLVNGSAQLMITSKDVKRLLVNLPCLEEQQKIATYLSSIDTKIEAVNNQITQIQTFKKGLLQQMFV